MVIAGCAIVPELYLTTTTGSFFWSTDSISNIRGDPFLGGGTLQAPGPGGMCSSGTGMQPISGTDDRLVMLEMLVRVGTKGWMSGILVRVFRVNEAADGL